MRGLRLAATAAIVGLAAEWTTPAQAHTQYYPINLSCAAGYDMQKGAYDSNVSNIYITIDAAGWRVGYKLSNGEAVFRQSQYNMTPSPVDANNHWTGTLRKQPTLFMRGELHEDAQDKSHFFYEERLWNEKQALVLYTKASCMRVTDFTSMTPVVGGPYEVPRQAYAPQPTTQQYVPPAQQYRPPQPPVDSVPIKTNGGAAAVDVYFASYGVPLTMLIDTGSSIMTLPQELAELLVQGGDAQWAGRTEEFKMADGSIQTKPILVVNSIRIGSHTLTGVEAAVQEDNNATPLLPYPVLSQIGRFSIDSKNNMLIFG